MIWGCMVYIMLEVVECGENGEAGSEDETRCGGIWRE